MSIALPKRRRVKQPVKSDERRSVAKRSAAHRDNGKATDRNLSFDTNSLYRQQTPENKLLHVEKVHPLPPAVVNVRLVGFVALPSDPEVPLTPEQLDTLFPPENRTLFVRELSRLALKGGRHE